MILKWAEKRYIDSSEKYNLFDIRRSFWRKLYIAINNIIGVE